MAKSIDDLFNPKNETTGARTILIVDDDELQRRTLSTVFKNEYNILTATNGAEAVKLFESERIHTTIMDVRMPVMDGIEAYRRIKEKHPNAQIVFNTGFANDYSEERILSDLHPAGYYTKGQSPMILKALVQTSAELSEQLFTFQDRLKEETDKRVSLEANQIELQKQASIATIAARIAHETKTSLSAVIDGSKEIGEKVIPAIAYVINSLKDDPKSLNTFVKLYAKAEPIFDHRIIEQRKEHIVSQISEQIPVDTLKIARDYASAGLESQDVFALYTIGSKHDDSAIELNMRTLIKFKFWSSNILEQALETKDQLLGFLDGMRHEQYPYERIDLTEYFSSIILPQMRGRFERHKVNVRFEPDDNKYLLSVHVPHLTESLLNILNNAVEAIQHDGNIQVQINPYEKNIGIKISNDGPPIENVDSIGKYQFTTKTDGTGLGLITAYKNIGSMQGTIQVESGLKETSFEVILPYKTNEAKK